jgi:hypothetical protein
VCGSIQLYRCNEQEALQVFVVLECLTPQIPPCRVAPRTSILAANVPGSDIKHGYS